MKTLPKKTWKAVVRCIRCAEEVDVQEGICDGYREQLEAQFQIPVRPTEVGHHCPTGDAAITGVVTWTEEPPDSAVLYPVEELWLGGGRLVEAEVAGSNLIVQLATRFLKQVAKTIGGVYYEPTPVLFIPCIDGAIMLMSICRGGRTYAASAIFPLKILKDCPLYPTYRAVCRQVKVEPSTTMDYAQQLVEVGVAGVVKAGAEAIAKDATRATLH